MDKTYLGWYELIFISRGGKFYLRSTVRTFTKFPELFCVDFSFKVEDPQNGR